MEEFNKSWKHLGYLAYAMGNMVKYYGKSQGAHIGDAA